MSNEDKNNIESAKRHAKGVALKTMALVNPLIGVAVAAIDSGAKGENQQPAKRIAVIAPGVAAVAAMAAVGANFSKHIKKHKDCTNEPD